MSDVDQAAFRRAAGQFPGGIVVVTTSAGHAMTVSAFASVSLEPPLVLFCAEKIARFHDAVLESGTWAVSILAEDGEQICRLFAQKGADRFAHMSYTTGRTGAPLLDAAMAFVDCETVAEHDAGDHILVVGQVLELGYAPEGKPLLFYRGGYGRFEV